MPGVGTTFRVILPASEPPARSTPPPRGLATLSRRVLVVDDEIHHLRAMTRLLGRVALVTTARTVDEALESLATGATYDLILCDLNMPSRPGTDLHAWLVRERPEMVPAFHLTTGGVYTDSAQKYLDTHEPQLMDKPLNTAQIMKLLGVEPGDFG